ncbi:MAG TPA: TIGR03067 domain-containing protein [Planctomycetota bacterium]|nr:TIGR03067 domain-containing protein [Planctomycetota bacterium]
MFRLAALLILCAPGGADDAVSKALQGRWTGARYTEGNGENQSGAQKLEVVFKDNTLVCAKESGALVGQATFAVSTDGKQIDCTGTSSGYQNKTYLGILKVEGDKLWWCTSGGAGKNQKRPGSFVANAGEASYLIVLTRAKP